MQRLRKIFIITALAASVFLSCLTLSGCDSGAKKIAFFVYDGKDTFISEMMDYMTASIPAGISADICDAGNSQAVQNQQIVELIDKGGYSLFIINAVDRLACSSIVEKCTREGIAVIFFNREPLADALNGDNVFYVGADADSLGEKQADMVAELISGETYNWDKNGDGIIQLVILKGEQGHQDAEKRTVRCVERLKELGYATQVLAIEVADWNRDEAYQSMSRLRSLFPDEIELVFSNNDDMALGAIDYLKTVRIFRELAGGAAAVRYNQSIIIVGVDGTTVGLEAISKGLLYGTVNNDHEKQANAILELMGLIIDNRDISDYSYTITNDHYIYVDGDTITLDNLVGYANF